MNKPNKNNQAPDGRQPKFIIIIGTNGTGKTTLLKSLITNELKKPESRVLLLTPDAAEFNTVPEVSALFPARIQRYSGARKLITTSSTARLNLILVREHFNKGLLIFDDSRAYLKASTLEILETILVRRRQMMIDLISVGHGPSKIPPAFFSYATHLIFFKTNDPITKRKDCLEDISRWEAIQAAVNLKAQTNPHYYEIHKI
jgi:Cdc6-like AAA superfamily ATPase